MGAESVIVGPAGADGSKDVIEIAFVLAGAISAGAWIAGVLDHIREALEDFEAWRGDARDPDRPRHRVEISVLAGTSGGGMSAALFAASLVGDPPAGQSWRSPLHQAWVEEIDIKDLLTLGDLEGLKSLPEGEKGEEFKPRSVLNSEPLDAIRNKVFSLTPSETVPAYVAPELHLYVTFTNLRGVGYSLALQGGEPHQMSSHADYGHFVLSVEDKTKDSDAIWLDSARPGDSNDAGWTFLGETALASGAFPVGLAPRRLERPESAYRNRDWQVPREQYDPETGACVDQCRLAPIVPLENGIYAFLSVDGGVMNNEPLDLARRTLSRGGRNPRSPIRARRVVVLIDPFPDPVDLAPRKPDIFAVFLAMMKALISQARFKPEDMLLAKDERTASRFAITPSRHIGEDKAANPLFSSIFDGFGGFLHRDIREHDYLLGRRNAEKFLKDWFRLARDNPVFGGWTGEGIGRRPKPMKDEAGKDIPCLPIIPCRENPELGRERGPQREPRLADLLDRVDQLMPAALERLKRVLIGTLPIPKTLSRLIWSFIMKGKARKAIFETLKAHHARMGDIVQ